MERSDLDHDDWTQLEDSVQALTDVLLAVARGEFNVRADRTHSGDAMDVLAFLVNSTAEEVEQLMLQLKAEQEELQRARDQLVLAAKLAALGGLAAGMAHELNQPLTAIRMLADMVRAEPDARVADVDADLEIIVDAARRMAKIVDGVRTFGRAKPLQLAPTLAADPLLTALQLLAEPLQHAGIRVETRVADELPIVQLDADRMHQVFVNLLSNARDALSTSPPSERRLEAEVSSNSRSVIYRIEDNGPGIPPRVVPNIFDLFFTTKAVGQGTGLGLSVSHGIVADHGGRIRYEPAADGGARFIVEVPVRSINDKPAGNSDADEAAE